MSEYTTDRRTAIVTGGSAGFGRAVISALAERGWRIVTDGRDAVKLRTAANAIASRTGADVVAIPGDITDPAHRRQLVETATAGSGRLDLLVNNAGGLGPTPRPGLDEYPLDALADLFAVNVVAPLGLVQEALPALGAAGGTIVDITSDAGVEPYEGWGGYGATKAALDHVGRIVAVEHPEVRVLTVDPGDMRTKMHQDAFPDEDISDRPSPDESVPGLLRLVDGPFPSGRYRVAEVPEPVLS